MLQCPNCKNEKPEIRIVHTVACETWVDGNGDVYEYEVDGNLTWKPTDVARCEDCGHVATVYDMTIQEKYPPLGTRVLYSAYQDCCGVKGVVTVGGILCLDRETVIRLTKNNVALLCQWDNVESFEIIEEVKP